MIIRDGYIFSSVPRNGDGLFIFDSNYFEEMQRWKKENIEIGKDYISFKNQGCPDYDVPLDGIKDFSGAAEWILHLTTKYWFNKDIRYLRIFISALRDHLENVNNK